MQGIGKPRWGLIRIAIGTSVLCLSGCGIFIPNQYVAKPDPELVIEPPELVIERVQVPQPTPPPKVLLPLPPVAIVLTSRQPAYEDIADELVKHLENYTIYDLSDRSQPPVAAFRLINDSDSRAVVAIGLRAAKLSVTMAETPVIFSQVFNHQDHDLLTKSSRGVASLAPLDAQIAAWKRIDPTLARVGAIVGEGHEDLMAEAESAAKRHAIELRFHTASSDQETLYLFKRMIRGIDGFWLFPDNRILSTRVLQQMIVQANRQNVPVAVSNESMLSIGAAISVSTVASDIAATIIEIIRQIEAGHIEQIPPLSPLSEVQVVTNEALLKPPASTGFLVQRHTLKGPGK